MTPEWTNRDTQLFAEYILQECRNERERFESAVTFCNGGTAAEVDVSPTWEDLATQTLSEARASGSNPGGVLELAAEMLAKKLRACSYQEAEFLETLQIDLERVDWLQIAREFVQAAMDRTLDLIAARGRRRAL